MGGATTFIDTKTLVQSMELDQRQELLKKLQDTDVCFSKFERKKTRPILVMKATTGVLTSTIIA